MSSSTASVGSTEEHGTSYLNAKSGIMSWLVTVDHKRIGVMYLGWILLFFLAGGLLAMGVRYELLDPQPTFNASTYNKNRAGSKMSTTMQEVALERLGG